MQERQTPASLPLAVDLDGTLLKTDVLFEGLAAALTRAPWLVLLAPLIVMLRGRPYLKRLVARVAPLDPETLPYREDFLSWLRSQHATGRVLALATAAARAPADAIARHLGLFEQVLSSDERVNLKSTRKADALCAAYPAGFAYAGDAGADLKVWSRARSAVLVDASASVTAQAQATGVFIEETFPRAPGALRLWRKALRVPHWLKNLLVFAAIPAAQAYADPHAWLMAAVGFVILCGIVSSCYLINDLIDLPSDRAHKLKRSRPFAAGDLPIAAGLVGGPVGIVLGLAAAFVLEDAFGWLASAYVVATLAYSFALKRAPFVDVLTLGGLFTLRVTMGAVLIGVSMSPYLFLFSMFLFTSIALAKRYAEAAAKAEEGGGVLSGRGYLAVDRPLIFTAGLFAAFGAVLLLVLYVVDAAAIEPFGQPIWLALLAPIIGAWLARMWRAARNGVLNEDPLLFAAHDGWSLALGAAFIGAYALAVI